MNKIQTKKSLLRKINEQYQFELKQLKKKKFCLKVRLMLTIVLPIFILVLFIKVAKTFIRIKIRKLFTKPFHDNTTAEPAKPKPVKPVPVKMTPVDMEILHPEPLSKDQ